jgi:hypothetical protein
MDAYRSQNSESLGDNAFEQIEAGFPQDPATLMVPGGTEGTQGLVFLCHASEDKPAVRDYAARLAEAGFTTWLDEEALLPSQDWDVEIRKAIERSCAVIVFLSARTQKRGYIQKEIARVLNETDRQSEGTIFLFPAKLEPAKYQTACRDGSGLISQVRRGSRDCARPSPPIA